MSSTRSRTASFSRRALLGAGAALPLFSLLTRPASAAEFHFKLATG